VLVGGAEGGLGGVGEELGHEDGLRCGGFRITDGGLEKACFTVLLTVRTTEDAVRFYGRTDGDLRCGYP